MTDNKDNALLFIRDTKKHILKVSVYMFEIINNLLDRAKNHDNSKINAPEIDIFANYSKKLSECEYNSNEYHQYLKDLEPALKHHYLVNDHHPEFFENGINDMSLIQLIEMLVDWKASSERMQDGNIIKSIEINQKRFNYSDDIKQLLLNTIRDLNW